MAIVIPPAPAAPPDPPIEVGVPGLLRLLVRAHAHAREHARAVSTLAAGIGRHLGLTEEAIEGLRLAGTLHDIGKLGVPAPIIDKPGPLSAAEWAVVRGHPLEGERLLRPFVARHDVLAAVRWHHERWDGAGYPDELRSSAIPLAARIVTVADAYSAMVERRPYRPPRTRPDALRELEANSALQFDPRCVSALADALEPSARPRSARVGRRLPLELDAFRHQPRGGPWPFAKPSRSARWRK